MVSKLGNSLLPCSMSETAFEPSSAASDAFGPSTFGSTDSYRSVQSAAAAPGSARPATGGGANPFGPGSLNGGTPGSRPSGFLSAGHNGTSCPTRRAKQQGLQLSCACDEEP